MKLILGASLIRYGKNMFNFSWDKSVSRGLIKSPVRDCKVGVYGPDLKESRPVSDYDRSHFILFYTAD